MAGEVFREVAEVELPIVLKTLEERFPKHFLLHQMLTVLEDYKKAGCPWKHTLYLYGDYHDGVYLNKLTIEYPAGDKIYLYVDTLNPELHTVKKALLETNVIPWEKKNYSFSHIDGKISGLIQSVLAIHKIPCGVSPNTMFWFPPSKDCIVEPLPEDTFVAFLDGSYAKEMESTWPHKFPGADLYIKENLEKNFGLGLFRKSDKKLVASALSNYAGGIFVLFCAPEFRGRGYATSLVQRIVQEIRRRGRIPFCTVILGYKPSEHVFRKTGFEVFSNADYLITRSSI